MTATTIKVKLTTRDMIFDRLPLPAIYAAIDKNLSNDAKLKDLSVGVGLLGQNLGRAGLPEQFSTSGRLRQIAGHCVGWIASLGVKEPTAALSKERERQISLRKRKPNRYLVDVAHPMPDETRKYRVVVEELGEVAKAIDELEMND